jgi:hypothetical protein
MDPSSKKEPKVHCLSRSLPPESLGNPTRPSRQAIAWFSPKFLNVCLHFGRDFQRTVPNRMLVSPVHQNHHSTQRQYHKEHCKNDYRHNLEPSAATAFRSAQHNRLSTLKLAIYLAAKISNRPWTEISHLPGIQQKPLLRHAPTASETRKLVHAWPEQHFQHLRYVLCVSDLSSSTQSPRPLPVTQRSLQQKRW